MRLHIILCLKIYSVFKTSLYVKYLSCQLSLLTSHVVIKEPLSIILGQSNKNVFLYDKCDKKQLEMLFKPCCKKYVSFFFLIFSVKKFCISFYVYVFVCVFFMVAFHDSFCYTFL